MPITPCRLWSSPWTGRRFASPCRRPMQPAGGSGAKPSARSKISATQHFSSPITIWAQGPPRKSRVPLARISPRSRRWPRRPRSRETLRIGCRVFCIDYHVPAVLAKEAATLDLLSDGRLEIGHRRGLERNRIQRNGFDFRPAGPANRQAGRGGVALSRRTARASNWTSPVRSFSVRGYAGRPRAGAAPAPADHDRRRWPTHAGVRRP